MSFDYLDDALTMLAAGVGTFNADSEPAHALPILAKLLIGVKITAALGVLEWITENYHAPTSPQTLAAAIRMLTSARLDLDRMAAVELRAAERLN